MHHFEVVNDAPLPLSWTPTRGNTIPPHAVPASEGPYGPLFVARGMLWGEMHIGTTSYVSKQGARLYDKYGQCHAVFEYEVLTCATSLRFWLEPSDPLSPVGETPRLDVRRESVSTASPPPKPRKLAPLPSVSPISGELATLPSQAGRKEHRNDPPPYASPKGGWVEVPKQSRPVALSAREDVQFNHLSRSKCFVLIDDTSSMQYSWSQTRAALAGTVDLLSSNAKWEGLDIRFIHHAQSRPCVKSREEFESLFNSVTMWRGAKVMTEKVAQIFEESISFVCEPCNRRTVNLLVITDGVAADAKELSDAILCFSQTLNRKSVPAHMFRMHILQMGEDRKAVQPLLDFRDHITQRDRETRILNLVSYHRGRGLLNAQNIFKLLLASTFVPFDEDPDIGERKPPEVIGAQYNRVAEIKTMMRQRR